MDMRVMKCDLCGGEKSRLFVQLPVYKGRFVYVSVCYACIRRMAVKELKKGGNHAK